MAMKGKNCVAIAADRRFGIQAQMVTTDFQKIFPMGLSNLRSSSRAQPGLETLRQVHNLENTEVPVCLLELPYPLCPRHTLFLRFYPARR